MPVLSDEYEDLNYALMEIRAAKSKLQERLRQLQTREWQLVDDIAEHRRVKRAVIIPIAPVDETVLAGKTKGETFNDEHYKQVVAARDAQMDAEQEKAS